MPGPFGAALAGLADRQKVLDLLDLLPEAPAEEKKEQQPWKTIAQQGAQPGALVNPEPAPVVLGPSQLRAAFALRRHHPSAIAPGLDAARRAAHTSALVCAAGPVPAVGSNASSNTAPAAASSTSGGGAGPGAGALGLAPTTAFSKAAVSGRQLPWAHLRARERAEAEATAKRPLGGGTSNITHYRGSYTDIINKLPNLQNLDRAGSHLPLMPTLSPAGPAPFPGSAFGKALAAKTAEGAQGPRSRQPLRWQGEESGLGLGLGCGGGGGDDDDDDWPPGFGVNSGDGHGRGHGRGGLDGGSGRGGKRQLYGSGGDQFVVGSDASSGSDDDSVATAVYPTRRPWEQGLEGLEGLDGPDAADSLEVAGAALDLMESGLWQDGSGGVGGSGGASCRKALDGKAPGAGAGPSWRNYGNTNGGGPARRQGQQQRWAAPAARLWRRQAEELSEPLVSLVGHVQVVSTRLLARSSSYGGGEAAAGPAAGRDGGMRSLEEDVPGQLAAVRLAQAWVDSVALHRVLGGGSGAASSLQGEVRARAVELREQQARRAAADASRAAAAMQQRHGATSANAYEALARDLQAASLAAHGGADGRCGAGSGPFHRLALMDLAAHTVALLNIAQAGHVRVLEGFEFSFEASDVSGAKSEAATVAFWSDQHAEHRRLWDGLLCSAMEGLGQGPTEADANGKAADNGREDAAAAAQVLAAAALGLELLVDSLEAMDKDGPYWLAGFTAGGGCSAAEGEDGLGGYGGGEHGGGEVRGVLGAPHPLACALLSSLLLLAAGAAGAGELLLPSRLGVGCLSPVPLYNLLAYGPTAPAALDAPAPDVSVKAAELAAPLQLPRRYGSSHLAFVAALVRQQQQQQPQVLSYALALTGLRLVVQRHGNAVAPAERALCLFQDAEAATAAAAATVSVGNGGGSHGAAVENEDEGLPRRPVRRVLDLSASGKPAKPAKSAKPTKSAKPNAPPGLQPAEQDEPGADLALAPGVPTPALPLGTRGAPEPSGCVVPVARHTQPRLLDCLWGVQYSRLPPDVAARAAAVAVGMFGRAGAGSGTGVVAPTASLPGPTWTEPMARLGLLDLDPQPSPSEGCGELVTKLLAGAARAHQALSAGELSWADVFEDLQHSAAAPAAAGRSAYAAAVLERTTEAVRQAVGEPRAAAVAAAYSTWLAAHASPVQRGACEGVLKLALLQQPQSSAAGVGRMGAARAFAVVVGELRPSLPAALPDSWGLLVKLATILARAPPARVQPRGATGGNGAEGGGGGGGSKGADDLVATLILARSNNEEKQRERLEYVAGLALLGLVALAPLVSGLPDNCIRLAAVVAAGSEVQLRGASALKAFTEGTGGSVCDWLHRRDGLPALAPAALTAFSLFALVPSPLLLPPGPDTRLVDYCSPDWRSRLPPPMPPASGRGSAARPTDAPVQDRLAAAAEHLYAVWQTAPEVAAALAEAARRAMELDEPRSKADGGSDGGSEGGSGSSDWCGTALLVEAVVVAAIRWLTCGRRILYDQDIRLDGGGNDGDSGGDNDGSKGEYDMDDFESDDDSDDDDNSVEAAVLAEVATLRDRLGLRPILDEADRLRAQQQQQQQQAEADKLMADMWAGDARGGGGGGPAAGAASSGFSPYRRDPDGTPPTPPMPPMPLLGGGGGRVFQLPAAGLTSGLLTPATGAEEAVDGVLLPLLWLSPCGATTAFGAAAAASMRCCRAMEAAKAAPRDRAKAAELATAQKALAAAEKEAGQVLAAGPAAELEVTVSGAAQVAALLLYVGQVVMPPFGVMFKLEPAGGSSGGGDGGCAGGGGAAGGGGGALRAFGFSTRRVPCPWVESTWVAGQLAWDRIKATTIPVRSEATKPADFLRTVRQLLVKKQQGIVRVAATGPAGIAHAAQLCARVRADLQKEGKMDVLIAVSGICDEVAAQQQASSSNNNTSNATSSSSGGGGGGGSGGGGDDFVKRCIELSHELATAVYESCRNYVSPSALAREGDMLGAAAVGGTLRMDWHLMQALGGPVTMDGNAKHIKAQAKLEQLLLYLGQSGRSGGTGSAGGAGGGGAGSGGLERLCLELLLLEAPLEAGSGAAPGAGAGGGAGAGAAGKQAAAAANASTGAEAPPRPRPRWEVLEPPAAVALKKAAAAKKKP